MRHCKGDIPTAYHQAGHCLISLHFGVSLVSVGIERRASWNVYRNVMKKGWIHHGRGATASLENCVLILLAGPTAEGMCPCVSGRDSYQKPLEDMTQVYVTLDEIGITSPARGPYMQQRRSSVERRLKFHWKEIEALANALLESKRLTGKQAWRILKEASNTK